MTGDGTSAVGRAVVQLTASLGRSEEAQLHGREALATVTDAWALHRQAAADTEAEFMVSAITHGEVARARVQRSIALLRACDASVQRYLQRIAPGLGPTRSDKEAIHPDGELLLVPQRPRTFRAARDFVLREADGGRQAASATREWVQNAQSFFEPPGPTGQLTSQPGPAPTYRTQHQAAGGDAVQTLTLLVVVAAKGAQVALSSVLTRMRKTRR